jgi:hypothetical protein
MEITGAIGMIDFLWTYVLWPLGLLLVALLFASVFFGKNDDDRNVG